MIRRHLAIVWAQVAASLQRELQYPVHLVISVAHGLLIGVSGWVALRVMFEHAPALGGWTWPEALVLFGVFMTFEALVEAVLHPNLDALPERIRTGQLDYDLLRPASAQLLVSTRHLAFWHLTTGAMGLGLVLWGMNQLEVLRPATLLWASVAWASGAAILYSLWLAVSASAFWFVKIDNASVPLYTLLGTGRFPVSAAPAWARTFLTFVVPVALITNVPAAVATHRLAWPAAVGSAAAGLALLWLSRRFWRFAVRHYTSASS
ncbi:MAG: ABC-2 family transporter protein [Myxococcales bacterium]|nr:ABC-2 family transporter protein [Myxococcales bacterium]